jgi:hypothetical protein
MTTPSPAASLEGVIAAANSAGPKGLPPVHLWNPAHCGEIDIVIRRDGLWFHEGSPIGREALVRLFSRVLRNDPDVFHLVTPVEKMRITVEDAPFIAVELFWRNDGGHQVLSFRTNLDEMVTADAQHPIRIQLDPISREPRPYVMVRPGLEARINRAVFYELVALAEAESLDGRQVLGVWSQGVFFPIDDVPQHELAAE